MSPTDTPSRFLRWHRYRLGDGTLSHYADSPFGRYRILRDGIPSCPYTVHYAGGDEHGDAVSSHLSAAKEWCEADYRQKLDAVPVPDPSSDSPTWCPACSCNLARPCACARGCELHPSGAAKPAEPAPAVEPEPVLTCVPCASKGWACPACHPDRMPWPEANAEVARLAAERNARRALKPQAHTVSAALRRLGFRPVSPSDRNREGLKCRTSGDAVYVVADLDGEAAARRLGREAYEALAEAGWKLKATTSLGGAGFYVEGIPSS